MEAASRTYIHQLEADNERLQHEVTTLRHGLADGRRKYHQSMQMIEDLVNVIGRLRTARERGDDMHDYAELEIAARLAGMSAGTGSCFTPGAVAAAPALAATDAATIHVAAASSQWDGGGSEGVDGLLAAVAHPTPPSPPPTAAAAPAAESRAPSSNASQGSEERFQAWLDQNTEPTTPATTPVKNEPVDLPIDDGIPSISRTNTPLRSTGRRAKRRRLAPDAASRSARRLKAKPVDASAASPHRPSPSSRLRSSRSPLLSPSSSSRSRRVRSQRRRDYREELSPSPSEEEEEGGGGGRSRARGRSLRAATRHVSYEDEVRGAAAELGDELGLGEIRLDTAGAAVKENDHGDDDGALEDAYVPVKHSPSSSSSSEGEEMEDDAEPHDSTSRPLPSPSSPTQRWNDWTTVNSRQSTDPSDPSDPAPAPISVLPSSLPGSRPSLPPPLPPPSSSRYSRPRFSTRRFASALPGVHFEFLRKPRSIVKIYEEWHLGGGGLRGNPPIAELEAKYGTAWRSIPQDNAGMKYASNYVAVRKVVVEFIDREVEALHAAAALEGSGRTATPLEMCRDLDLIVKGKIQLLTKCLRDKRNPFEAFKG